MLHELVEVVRRVVVALRVEAAEGGGALGLALRRRRLGGGARLRLLLLKSDRPLVADLSRANCMRSDAVPRRAAAVGAGLWRGAPRRPSSPTCTCS